LIHSIYDGDDSVTQLQELFFQRNQKDDETLQDYSLNLMKIVDQIIKRDNTVLGDKDKVLKDRFIEGIKEPHLKREVKRCSFEHKTIGDMRFCIGKSILDFSSGIVIRCSRASSNQSLIIGSTG
jgi:hypothetical protein